MRDVLAVSLDDRPRAFAVGRLARFHQRREVGHHPLECRIERDRGRTQALELPLDQRPLPA